MAEVVRRSIAQYDALGIRERERVVYVLESCKVRGWTYVGETKRPRERLLEHNGMSNRTKGASFTRGRRPWRAAGIVRGFRNIKDARRFERDVKLAKAVGSGVERKMRAVGNVAKRAEWKDKRLQITVVEEDKTGQQ
jgi:predicted GIY-YIG superfamily endonuclease